MKTTPFEYRWTIDPAGYKQIEVFRDVSPKYWEAAQIEIESFISCARRSSLALSVYLFPLEDGVWHNVSAEAVIVLRALLSSS